MRVIAFALFSSVAARLSANSKPLGGPEPSGRFEYTQRVSHFNAERTQSFQQRYWVEDKHYRPGGPMFFYAGNEGPLEAWWASAGLLFDWAPHFNALVVFAEHRYYGRSLPFGNASFAAGNRGFLSIAEALADYATLVPEVRTARMGGRGSVVAFGGSYGGILAAYLRIKYPNVFDAALAASAPIPQVIGLTPPTSFYQAVTEDAANADARCPDLVRAGFAAAVKKIASAAGRAEVAKAFGLCSFPDKGADHFLQFARNAWTEVAMCDYPYASNFLAPLPANPINAMCDYVVNASDPLHGLGRATRLPYAQGDECMDMYKLFVDCADPTGCGVDNDAKAWDLQMCTEVSYEVETTNTTDMFPPSKFDFAKRKEYCERTYNISPMPLDWIRVAFGGADLARVTSRIIFSNGRRDPWHPGGFLHSLSDDLPAVIIDVGAHHLDLRGATPEDPAEITAKRLTERAIIEKWLASTTPQSAAVLV
jgi:dipeptidyl-peptidase-2